MASTFAPMEAPPVRVTVLTTLYNKGAYVEEAVRSVLAQTFTDLELLVVDDASTDGGLEKVKAIADPRIRILESPVNTGRAAAANRGYDAARGDYVAVLDADDLMHPERLAKQVHFMDRHPEIAVCGSAISLFGMRDSVVHLPATDAEARVRMLFNIPVVYGACLIRRSVLEEGPLRCDGNWRLPGMDYLFMLAISAHGAFANLPEVLTYYRQGEQNMRHGRDHLADMDHLYREVLRYLGIPFTEEELHLHLMGCTVFLIKPTPERLRALHHWYGKLLDLNDQYAFVPKEVFAAGVEQQWNKLFHYLPRYGTRTALMHLRLSRKWPLAKLTYLAKYRTNALLGKLPNG
jgi:glycosyltransferase involved in cell wall biosynthesis